MKKLWMLVVAIFAITMVNTFAAPFPDTPSDHWAYDAVSQLAAKGLVEGYPDGLFRGDRAASRYEMAMVVARLLARVEEINNNLPDMSNYVTKSDLETVKRLLNEYRDELDAMGVRVKNAEDAIASLEKRVERLEKIMWSGDLQSVYFTQGIYTDADWPGRNPRSNWWLGGQNPVSVDYTAYTDFQNRIYMPGYYNAHGLTTLGHLYIDAKVAKDYKAGITLTAYQNAWTNGGNFGYLYGPTAPYFKNPQMGAFGGVPSIQTDLSLTSFYLENTKTGTKLTVGEYYPETVPNFIYEGMPNLSIFGKDYLPAYGWDIHGSFSGVFSGNADSTYEVYQSRVPNAAIGLSNQNFDSDLFGFSLYWVWGEEENAKLGIHFQRIQDNASVGFIGNPVGLMGTGVNPGNWQFEVAGWDNGGNAVSANIGIAPQREYKYGLDFYYKFNPQFCAYLKWAGTSYKPNANFGDSWAGSLIDLKLAGKLFDDKSDWYVQYISVAPDYDPYVAGIYNWNTFNNPVDNNPAINPNMGLGPYAGSGFYQMLYPVVYNGFYQFHNSKMYPNNRTGFRLYFDYKWAEKSKVWVKYEALTQYNASNVEGTTAISPTNAVGWTIGLRPGFYEPIFLNANNYNDLPKGHINNFEFGFKWQINDAWRLFGQVDSIRILRSIGDTSAGNILNWNGNTFVSTYTVPGAAVAGTDRAWNNIDLRSTFFNFGVGWQQSDKFDWLLDYTSYQAKGDYMQPSDPNRGLVGAARVNSPDNVDFFQSAIRLKFNYKVNEYTKYFIQYKAINMDDRVDYNGPAGNGNGMQADWHGNQIMTGITIKF